MNSLFERSWRQLISATGLALAFALGAVVLAQPPDPRTGDGRQATDGARSGEYSEEVEYLTRGPLHEAFAEPYGANPAPAPLIARQPPEPIEELPPEYRPEGDNVSWIPGYWAWDDEREDFLWISGLWRELPPDQRWVPGYWVGVERGSRWVSGFWASSQLAEVEYLPMPPESLEQGPSAPSPAENHFYVPGHWVYQANDYQWRPGFWSPVYDNWVWVPAQYIWTPRGTLFRPGYWDYDIAYRGIVFTPVYYRQPVYRSPQFFYQPRYTIDTGVNLLVHLFVRPNARQYYFGDYYGPRYVNTYQPWIVRYQQPAFYDPFYAQYRYRAVDPTANVLTWVTNQHEIFERSERIRPPRTVAEQRQFVLANRETDIDPVILRSAAFAEAIENVVEGDDSHFQFRVLDRTQQQLVREAIRPMRELSRSRQSTETVAVAPDLTEAVPDDARPDARPRRDDPQDRLADPRPVRDEPTAHATLQLPAITRDPSEQYQQERAVPTEQTAGQQAEGTVAQPDAITQDLPPGRGATELTPEEQRDRRFDARAATPPITGETPAIGESPGLAEERPGVAGDRRGVAGPGRGVAGARPGVAGARPGEAIDPADAAVGRPGVATPEPAATETRPGARPAATRERPAAREPRLGDASEPAPARETPETGQPADQPTPQTLPGTTPRDPAAGQRLRGDVREIDREQRRQQSQREGRMRPARPEGWPMGQPSGQRARTLPTRPGQDPGVTREVESLLQPGVLPGGRPEIGGSAPGLSEGAVPRAGNLAPGGAPGVERGAPDSPGTSREREAQPFTLPDISEEAARRMRR